MSDIISELKNVRQSLLQAEKKSQNLRSQKEEIVREKQALLYRKGELEKKLTKFETEKNNQYSISGFIKQASARFILFSIVTVLILGIIHLFFDLTIDYSRIKIIFTIDSLVNTALTRFFLVDEDSIVFFNSLFKKGKMRKIKEDHFQCRQKLLETMETEAKVKNSLSEQNQKMTELHARLEDLMGNFTVGMTLKQLDQFLKEEPTEKQNSETEKGYQKQLKI